MHNACKTEPTISIDNDMQWYPMVNFRAYSRLTQGFLGWCLNKWLDRNPNHEKQIDLIISNSPSETNPVKVILKKLQLLAVWTKQV